MEHIEASDAEGKLGQLLDRVEAGEAITILRDGKPVAALIPAQPSVDIERARAAAENIRKMSKGVTLGGLTFRDLIDDGRP